MRSVEHGINEDVFQQVAAEFGTPIFVYDEQGIRDTAQNVIGAFGAHRADYVNHFAVKALPSPRVLEILEEEGMGFDCATDGEAETLFRYGLGANGISYTSNNLGGLSYEQRHEAYMLPLRMGALVNLDKEADLERLVLNTNGQLPSIVGVRLNPGAAKEGSELIGNPIGSKFGEMPHRILEMYKRMTDLGVQRLALHTMVGSNELDPHYFGETAQLLARFAQDVYEKTGLVIDTINIGGGLGINYDKEQSLPDIHEVAGLVMAELEPTGARVVSEFGRYVTGPHGYLLTTVVEVVDTYESYVQVDSSVNNNARLASVKDATHDIKVIGREPSEPEFIGSLVGSQCSGSDKMLKNVSFPTSTQRGDLVVVSDMGAHARANATNFNGLHRAGEVLVNEEGAIRLIRRPETWEDIDQTVV